MAERLVLHPPTHLVQAPVPDAHDVERIGDADGVVQLGRQPGPEGLRQVGGHHLDASDPLRIGVLGPSPQVSGRIALDHVDEDLGPKIDQTGGVDGGVGSVGPQEGGLVHPELGHGTDARRVVHQRRAVLDHGVHHRPPAHAQLGGHPRNWSGLLAHLAACLGAGPAGEHGLGVDVIGMLGPGLGVAVGIDTSPPALDPHQPGRAPEAGQIPDVDRHPVLGLGPHATA